MFITDLSFVCGYRRVEGGGEQLPLDSCNDFVLMLDPIMNEAEWDLDGTSEGNNS